MGCSSILSEETDLFELLFESPFFKVICQVTVPQTVVLWKLNGVSACAVQDKGRRYFLLSVFVPSLATFLFAGSRVRCAVFTVFCCKVISLPRLNVASRLAFVYFDFLLLVREERLLLLRMTYSSANRRDHSLVE